MVYFIFFRFSIPSFRRRSLSAWLSGVWHYFPARYCLLAGFRLVDDTVPEPESPLPTADRLAVAKVGASRPRRAPSLSPLTVPPTPSATPPSYPYLHLEENLHHKLSSHRFPHISTTPARLEPNSMSPLLAAKTLKQLRNRYKYKCALGDLCCVPEASPPNPLPPSIIHRKTDNCPATRLRRRLSMPISGRRYDECKIPNPDSRFTSPGVNDIRDIGLKVEGYRVLFGVN
uniref:HDC09483 n=1 Tax=Drosophila melanogaster TaxID=7227 RepID=Q6ILG4_DROME|nr:TPA_inf: HDC09483 [Drosophila melanogaster]